MNALTWGAVELTDAITELLQETEKRVFQRFPYHKLPFSQGAKRFNKSKAIISECLMRIINEKKDQLAKERREIRKTHEEKGEGKEEDDDRLDVLDRLLRVTDPTLTDEQLLNEAMVILLAGHGNLLSFSFFKTFNFFPFLLSLLFFILS